MPTPAPPNGKEFQALVVSNTTPSVRRRRPFPPPLLCVAAVALVVAAAGRALSPRQQVRVEARPGEGRPGAGTAAGGPSPAPPASLLSPANQIIAGTASGLPTAAPTAAPTSAPISAPTAATMEDPGGPDFRWPRVAWIMSFPNSGTSYTMRLVQRMSNMTGASNYGQECDVNGTGWNYPVYDDFPDGPFWSQPSKRRLPTRYLPTKTHCGGYTTTSGPDKYLHTSRSFMVQCLTGNRIAPEFDADGNVVVARGKALSQVEKLHTFIDPSLVQRAVHVVRDPFDNVVSRFHLEQHVHEKKNDTEWMEKFPSSPDGFQAWCRDMDDANREEEQASRLLDPYLIKAFEGVPCHSEFFRYTQWHNLALATTEKMRLPSLIHHYERFEEEFDLAYNELFDFLELPRDGVMSKFIPGKKYADYFDFQQRKRAIALVKLLCEPPTWRFLERYDTYY